MTNAIICTRSMSSTANVKVVLSRCERNGVVRLIKVKMLRTIRFVWPISSLEALAVLLASNLSKLR